MRSKHAKRNNMCSSREVIVTDSPEYEQMYELSGSLLVANIPLPAPGIVESYIFTPSSMELSNQHTSESKHTFPFLHRVPFSLVCVHWPHVSGHDQSGSKI